MPRMIWTLAFATIVITGAALMAQHEHEKTQTSSLAIPEALKIEHDDLHRDLAVAMKLPGKTGQAARRVEELLHPHFLREEEFALPPLGLLRALSMGQHPSSADEALRLTGRLEAEMPRMLEEHKAIVSALEDLTRAGRAERHPEAAAFADTLTLHAKTEEQVLYPAALLVGAYLKRLH